MDMKWRAAGWPSGWGVPALLAGHVAALAFGVIGILIMLPNPDLWASDPRAVRVFDLSMKYAGPLPIILGAATMLAFGIRAIGWRKTLIFAVASCTISLSSELFGTGTGWPFGNYAYTDFLGYKVLGRVPFTIPLSWFCMGFASYLLGTCIAARLGVRRQTLWSLALGAWLLTAWDLVLDPAMAHPDLHIQFWRWDETGPYFGMPIKNLAGWSLTGLLFMAVSRFFWREDANAAAFSLRIPLLVYLANLAFAMAISIDVDLWEPVVLALAVGALPALAATMNISRPGRAVLRWSPNDYSR
jgi:putative membrane protein